jgi:hypothetical protein
VEWHWARRAITICIAVALAPIAAPELLAFPYSARFAGHEVYSERPIDARLAAIVAQADALVSRSELGNARPLTQPIFLTGGGWRWTWLAARSRGAFALSRPWTENIVVNGADAGRDLARNGASIGGSRSLHGVIAHEMAHGSIRAHFGMLSDWRYPAQLREGYCDHVAGSGSLSDADAHALEDRGRSSPALTYWRGRKAVDATLAENGDDVDRLFADWR